MRIIPGETGAVMCQPFMYIFTDIEPDIRITPILYCASRLVASRSGSNARRRRRRLRSHRESAGDVEVLKALPPGLAMFLTLPRGLRGRRPLGIRRQWDARRATSRNRVAGNVFGSRRAGSGRRGCSASSAGSADRGVRVCGLSGLARNFGDVFGLWSGGECGVGVIVGGDALE